MIQFHVDQLNSDFVSGWAFSDQGEISITIKIDGQPTGRSVFAGLERPDVRDHHPAHPSAFRSGFTYAFGPGDFGGASGGEALLDANFSDGHGPANTYRGKFLRPWIERENLPPPSSQPAPLPRSIARIVRTISGEPRFGSTYWDDQTTCAAIDLIAHVV